MSSLYSSSSSHNDQPMCRISRYGLLPEEIFKRVSCTNCYKLLEFVFSEPKFTLKTNNDGFLVTDEDERIDPNSFEGMKYIEKSLDTIEFEKWRSCCDDAAKCCEKMIPNRLSTNLIDGIARLNFLFLLLLLENFI